MVLHWKCSLECAATAYTWHSTTVWSHCRSMTRKNNQDLAAVSGESSCILLALSIALSYIEYLVHAGGSHWRIYTLYMFLYSEFFCFFNYKLKNMQLFKHTKVWSKFVLTPLLLSAFSLFSSPSTRLLMTSGGHDTSGDVYISMRQPRISCTAQINISNYPTWFQLKPGSRQG